MFNLDDIEFDISKINFGLEKAPEEKEVTINYLNPDYKDANRTLKVCHNDLKNIVDALEYFIKDLKEAYDNQTDAYHKLSVEYKIKDFTKISEIIKSEINYCSKCKKNNKKNNSNGYDPLMAGHIGINNLDK